MSAPDRRAQAAAALEADDDLRAIVLLRADLAARTPGTRDWAESSRLLGLALIKASWEVEGTQRLEEAAAVLDRLDGP